MTYTAIWWVRRDIRLDGNEALQAALNGSDRFFALFVIEPDLMASAAPKRRDFLVQALTDLDRQLRARGSRLVIRSGPAGDAFQALSAELGTVRIFAHQDFSPFACQRDQAIARQFDLRLYPGTVLRHPDQVLKNDGSPYTVFTPYKNKWYSQPLPTPADCLPAPDRFPSLPEKIPSEPLPDSQPVAGFPATSEEAQARLAAFLRDGIRHYRSRRDRLDLDGTSALSPYLRFGLLSPRTCFTEAQIKLLQATEDERDQIRTWMDELVWREFYTAILYHFPEVMDGPFRKAYQNIPWRDAPDDLAAWQQGRTGYPIVDACLRQLLETGWMHNRGRMIAASFLTKDLLINWQEGETWFMANLVDGDPAANNGGWQWTAGTGTDAAPYFRIFNPVIQGEKFDPEGAYIARWVPELKNLPVKYRHQPWKLPDREALQAGFTLGKDYPHPLVDHAFARQRTLAAYQAARTKPPASTP